MCRLVTSLISAVLMFSYLIGTTSSQEAYCDPQVGPAGQTICFYDNDAKKLDWSSCVSNSYIQIKTAGAEQCERGYPYCLYGCLDEGILTGNCECSEPTEYMPPDSAIPMWCYDPQGTNCRWYRECLNTKHPCEDSANGYALAYAEHFCSLYTANVHDSKFSQRAIEWIDAVRKCLQIALVPLIRPWHSPTCEQIKDIAFDSHTGCYISPAPGAPSICSLGPRDWLAVFWTIKGSFVSATTDTLKGIVQTTGKCTWKLGEELSSALGLKLRLVLDWFRGKRSTSGVDADAISGEVADELARRLGWDNRTLDWFAYAPENSETNDWLDVVILLADKLSLDLTQAPDAPVVNLMATLNELVTAIKDDGGLQKLQISGGNVTISSITQCDNPICTQTSVNGTEFPDNSSQRCGLNPIMCCLFSLITAITVMWNVV